MASHFTEIRGQAQAIDVETVTPTNPATGQTYFDNTSGKLYIFDGSIWRFSQGTTTSTSTTSSSSSSSSTSSTSTSSTSSSTSSTSSSSSSSSTSTTLLSKL